MSAAQDGRGFQIVDNVLLGDEAPLRRDAIHAGQLILEGLKSKPNFVGQIDGISGKRATYTEMREKSVKCAIWLKEQGIRRNDVVGICAGNLTDAYVPLFAAFYINAVTNPWDDELTIRTAKYFLSLTSPKVVFANASSAEKVKAAAREENLDVKLVIFEESAEFESLPGILQTPRETREIEDFRCEEIQDPDDTCLICCSSGTTGLPKGSEISHFSLINYIMNVDIMNLENHVSMWMPTIRWHYGLSLLVKATLDYSTRILVEHYIDDESLCELIQKYSVTWFGCGSGVASSLLKHGVVPKFPLPSLRVFLAGGSHLKKETQTALRKHLPRATIVQTYGMTDIGGICNHQKNHSKPGSCGPVCKNMRLKVVELETGKPLASNQTGEVWIKSPYAMKGYYNNQTATRELIDADGFAHSGDIGYYDEDGELFIVGRISEFLLYKSINVSPRQIEELLEKHPAVLEAAVVPITHELDDEHPMAFVLKVPGKEVEEEELIHLVEDNLEYYSRLRAGVKFVDKFPRTATGKIAKSKLKEIAATLWAK